jgi:hypothetical protein
MKWILRTFLAAGAALTLGAVLASAVSADTSNTNSNTQTASNTATSAQTVASVSGMATASGAGSAATSGAATAAASSAQYQKIKQKAANQVAAVLPDSTAQLPWSGSGNPDDPTMNSNTNSQGGIQAAGTTQSAAAASLDASASGEDSVAVSGDSTSLAEQIQEQILKQFSINQGLFVDDGEDDEEEEEAP